MHGNQGKKALLVRPSVSLSVCLSIRHVWYVVPMQSQLEMQKRYGYEQRLGRIGEGTKGGLPTQRDPPEKSGGRRRVEEVGVDM